MAYNCTSASSGTTTLYLDHSSARIPKLHLREENCPLDPSTRPAPCLRLVTTSSGLHASPPQSSGFEQTCLNTSANVSAKPHPATRYAIPIKPIRYHTHHLAPIRARKCSLKDPIPLLNLPQQLGSLPTRRQNQRSRQAVFLEIHSTIDPHR